MLALRAERKSPSTLKTYGDGVRFYLRWSQDSGREPLERDSLRTWVAELVEPLTDDQLRDLIAACQPPRGATPAEAQRHRRDEAIVRLMLETGARAWS